MALTRNNFIMYRAPIQTIGGVNDETAAAGILSKYDFVVVIPHLLTDLPKLREVLQAYKVMNPRGKVFGYTDLGGAASVGAWQAQADQWVTDVVPTSTTTASVQPLLAGLFIDNFGSEQAMATRVNQNTAVDYAHGLDWSVMVNPLKVFDAFDLIAGDAPATFGKTPALRDYVLLDNFYFINAAGTTLVAETAAHREGRLDYAKDVAATQALGTPAAYNIGFIAQVGAGDQLAMLEADWLLALGLANSYRMEGFGVAPFDRGTTSNRFFMKFTGNLYE